MTESPTDWRRWVPPEVRRELILFMIRAFVVGAVTGLVAGSIYWHWSQSKEKVFQGAIIVAALAFTMPAFATSLKLMLSMFYMSWSGLEKSGEAWKTLSDIKDEVRPILTDVKDIVKRMSDDLDRQGPNGIVKAAVAEAKALIGHGTLDRWEGKLDRLLVSLEGISQPLGPKPLAKPGLLERGVPKPVLIPAGPGGEAGDLVPQPGHAT